MKVHSLPACVFSCSPGFLSGGYFPCEADVRQDKNNTSGSAEAIYSICKLFFISIMIIMLPAPVILIIFCCDAPFKVLFNIEQFTVYPELVEVSLTCTSCNAMQLLSTPL